jgi:hypothetical protein
MLSEKAKDIPGFEGVYAVTEDGRVYSHSRVVKAAHGSTQLRKGRWLKPKINQGRVLYNIGAKCCLRLTLLCGIAPPERHTAA